VTPGRAPINYEDVSASYNTVRAIGAGLIIGVGVAGWIGGIESFAYLGVVAALVAIHALFERRRGTNASAPLLVDATMLGIVGLILGFVGGFHGAVSVYLVAGSVLLLPFMRALAVIAYTMAWTAPVLLLEPFNPTDETLVIELAAITAGAIIVGRLLFATGQALFAAERRHRDALEAERRAVELKDEFVSMVSHELRTPLTSIGGFADTLHESWAKLPPKEVDEFLVIMRGEANHLSNLVEDILVIPRLEAGRLRLEPATIGLREEAYAVSRLVFAGITREVQIDVPADVNVTADPDRLRQIFRNLLENARKYGGDQVLIAGERMGDEYKVVIADNGPGIPVEDRQRIFEHFEQAVKGDARSEGVGLGLPIARKLARAMGGDLWFEPRFPTGAQFLFTIDLAGEGDVAAGPTPTTVTPIRHTG